MDDKSRKIPYGKNDLGVKQARRIDLQRMKMDHRICKEDKAAAAITNKA